MIAGKSRVPRLVKGESGQSWKAWGFECGSLSQARNVLAPKETMIAALETGCVSLVFGRFESSTADFICLLAVSQARWSVHPFGRPVLASLTGSRIVK